MSSAVADSCKADASAGDCLQFYIDGVLKDAIDGEADWVQKSYEITAKKGVKPTFFTFGLSIRCVQYKVFYRQDANGGDSR